MHIEGYRPFAEYFDNASLLAAPGFIRRAVAPIRLAFTNEGPRPLRVHLAWTKTWWFTFFEGRGSAQFSGDQARMAADYLLLVLTLSGQNRPSGPIPSLPRPGEMTLMPWRAEGGFISSGEFKYLFAFIPKADLIAAGCDAETLPLDRTVSALTGAGAPFASALRTLAAHASRPDDRDSLALSLPALARFTLDVFSSPVPPGGARSAGHDRIDHILAYMADHFGLRDLTARQVAIACGLSVRQVFRSFDQAGMTFAEQLRSIRLERACELLAFQARLPVAEIAAATGFSSPSHFSRVFRASLGTTPLRFRKSQRVYQDNRDI